MAKVLLLRSFYTSIDYIICKWLIVVEWVLTHALKVFEWGKVGISTQLTVKSAF